MTHLLVIDELYRQLLAGEIDRAYYEAMRDNAHTAPSENLCSVPRCTRQAYRVDRGHALCAVCWQRAVNARRRGLS